MRHKFIFYYVLEIGDKNWNCFNLVNNVVWKYIDRRIIVPMFCGDNKTLTLGLTLMQ